MSSPDLTVLSRADDPSSIIPTPRARFITRVLVPTAIVAGVLALLLYTARESWRPALPVVVAPVVLKPDGPPADGDRAASGEVVQAPGWLEAGPYAIGVPALTSGVIKELAALEGERVEAGQIIARLLDDDARLNRRLAAADQARAEAVVAEARAAASVERARRDEASDALRRADSSFNGAGESVISEGERTARRQRLATAEAMVAAAEATVARAGAEVERSRVVVDEAELMLARTEIRAPSSGVVLQRLVEPGQRVMLDVSDPNAGLVLRLYDPAHLQARVDIPLADAAKVRLGDAAELTTEALPDRVFHATLDRFVHEANVQKNTVQVKITLRDPAPELKPEMLVKARIATRAAPGAENSSTPSRAGAEGVLLAPRRAIVDAAGEEGAAWVLRLDTSTAERRTLKLGRAAGDTVEVLGGLRPGDRLILDPPAGLRPGAEVEASESSREDK